MERGLANQTWALKMNQSGRRNAGGKSVVAGMGSSLHELIFKVNFVARKEQSFN